MISPSKSSCRAVGGVCVLSILMSGCGRGGFSPGVFSGAPWSGPVVIDGSRHDWADRSMPIADENFLYLPISVEGASDPLQAMDESLVLLLDVDGDPTTGKRGTRPRVASTLGAELRIEFSPASPQGPRPGVRVQMLDNSGSWTEGSHADIGLVALPTHASDWFEIRIDRRLTGAAHFPEAGMRSVGSVSGMWVLHDNAGVMVGWSDPFTVALPQASDAARGANVAMPQKEAGEVRIVSYNVHGEMSTNPEQFARMLDALGADIVLLQEWEGGSGLSLETWLTANLAQGAGWHTVMGESPGVAVAARGALRPLGPGRIELGDSERPVRFVGALVESSAGPVAVASVHLKCCGGAGGVEDARRTAEAEAINRALMLALGREGHAARVVMGDLNLVGAVRPIETLRAGLDSDGTDLDVVDALVLGDSSAATWMDDDVPFAPGRLDYALVGEASARVARSFVFDTRVLDAASLARIGLDATDSAASDHLPLVVDIVPRRR